MFQYRDVNDAFRLLILKFNYGVDSDLSTIRREDSRNGPVLRIEHPVLVKYEEPTERVLFNKARDANPFFHLVEALWMLAGRRGVIPLSFFNSRIHKYSDDGVTFNAAYGYRWRNYYESVDQLMSIARHLKLNPESRRAVLTMWTVLGDLDKVNVSKDVACNTHIYFSRDSRTGDLDMTVCNRSNDLIWGMLGANYVHMSFLQEYMASALGWGIGTYYHFTNNLHVYEDVWKKNAEKYIEEGRQEEGHPYDYIYKTVPLVRDLNQFDKEVQEFLYDIKALDANNFKEPFLSKVAVPMVQAYWQYKNEDLLEAINTAESIEASDWRIACVQWLRRRKAKRDNA